MGEAAANPQVQAAAYSAGAEVTRGVVSDGAQQAKAGFLEVQHYVQENHCSVKVLSFLASLALLVFSIVGMINPFGLVFQPIQYLFSFYNVLFAVVIIIMEGKADWFRKIGDIQAKLFTAASFL